MKCGFSWGFWVLSDSILGGLVGHLNGLGGRGEGAAFMVVRQ